MEENSKYTYYDSRKAPPSDFPSKADIRRRRLGMWLAPLANLLRNPFGLTGLLIILVFFLMALSQPILMNTVWDQNVYDCFTGYDFATEPHPTPPSRTHLFGTDQFGRDVLSRFLCATSTSLGVGVMAGITTALIALVVGVTAAYYAGWVDRILMLLAGAFVMMPPAFMILIIGLLVELNWLTLGLFFGIFAGLGSMAITYKSQALTVRVKPFVEASQVAGGGGLHIMLRHIVPGMLSVMLVTTMFVVSQAMLVEALISFFQGTQSRLSWGTMLLEIKEWGIEVLIEQWYVVLPPALAITLLAGSFYLLGRALDEVLNPRLQKR